MRKKEIPQLPMGKIIIGVVLLFAIFFAIGNIHIVGAGERGVRMNWGSVEPASLPEGLYLKVPFAQSIHNMNVKTQKVEAEASAASKDLQIVKTTVALNFKIYAGSAHTIFQEVGTNYADKVIAPSIQEAVKAATANFTAEELVTKRPIVRDQIEITLRERLGKYNMEVQNMSITNFEFSEQFNAAIESKVTAEQQALKAQRDLERIKIEAEQKVTSAKAESDSTKLQADASAYKIQKEAESEANKIRITGEAQGAALAAQRQELTPELVKYQIAKSWNGSVPQIVMGGSNSIPLINLDSMLSGN